MTALEVASGTSQVPLCGGPQKHWCGPSGLSQTGVGPLQLIPHWLARALRGQQALRKWHWAFLEISVAR